MGLTRPSRVGYGRPFNGLSGPEKGREEFPFKDFMANWAPMKSSTYLLYTFKLHESEGKYFHTTIL